MFVCSVARKQNRWVLKSWKESTRLCGMLKMMTVFLFPTSTLSAVLRWNIEDPAFRSILSFCGLRAFFCWSRMEGVDDGAMTEPQKSVPNVLLQGTHFIDMIVIGWCFWWQPPRARHHLLPPKDTFGPLLIMDPTPSTHTSMRTN